MKKVLLLLAIVAFSLNVSAQCTTSNATTCKCIDPNDTDCDLLPDIQIGHPPFYDYNTTFGIVEYSQTGNGVDNGRLKITVSTPNPGHGPLELRTTNVFVCGTDTFVGSAPSICPDGVTYPSILINQRIYHKNGSSMTSYDRPAGTMTYHPTHNHMHVDHWGDYTLRIRDSSIADPRQWPIVGSGTKLAFCVMDYGNCTTYPDHCLDTTGSSLNNSSDFPNYGLGGGNYNCSPTIQGISSGYVDIYWTTLDGMWINVPPGTCNGEYWIVCEIDPNNNFLEEYEDNNVFAVPFTLTKQEANPFAVPVSVSTSTSQTTICQGDQVTLTPNTSLVGATFLWSNGATTPTISVGTSGTYTCNITNACGSGTTVPVTINVNAAPLAPSATNDTLATPGTATLSASGGTNYNWYDQPTGGSSLGTGSTFTTPLLNASATFYVSDAMVTPGLNFTTGVPSNTSLGNGGYLASDQSLLFDCLAPFILHQVTIYSQNAATITVNLENASGTTIDTRSVSLTAGMNVVTLDFNVAVGSYQLSRTGGNLYRNNNVTVNYPITVPGYCSITGSSAGADFYYFFYDWKINTPDVICEGPRSPVEAVVLSPNSIADATMLKNLKIYPNPASNYINISFTAQGLNKLAIDLIDVTGRVVMTKAISSANFGFDETLNISNLAKGVYNVRIYSEAKNYTTRLVIN